MGVTEHDTDLRRGSTLSGELADLLDDLLGSSLQPAWRCAGVGDGGGRNALALAVKSTHLGCVLSWWTRMEAMRLAVVNFTGVKVLCGAANFRLVRAVGG